MADIRATLLARMQKQKIGFNPLEDHSDPDAQPEKVAFVQASLWRDMVAFIAGE